MRFRTDGSYDGWLYRTVNFYLYKSVFFIPLNGLYGLFPIINLYDAKRHRAFSINNTSFQDMRSNSFAIINRFLNRVDIPEFIAAISYSSYTCGEVSGSPFSLFEVCMHIP